jgi:hypothetical protein
MLLRLTKRELAAAVDAVQRSLLAETFIGVRPLALRNVASITTLAKRLPWKSNRGGEDRNGSFY